MRRLVCVIVGIFMRLWWLPKGEILLKPLVSVIVRTSESRRGCLSLAVDSVLKQTYKTVELVLVENGSSSLDTWVEQFRTDTSMAISYYNLEEADRCLAGNLGLSKSKGSYCCFLDDDDILYPEHLSVLVDELEKNPLAGAAYSVAEEVPTNISSYTPFVYTEEEKRIIYRREFSRGTLFVRNYLPIQSVLFRKSLYEEHGGFHRHLEKLEDWNLWCRYASNSDFIFIDRVTSFYRVPGTKIEFKEREIDFSEFHSKAVDEQEMIKTKVNLALLREIIREYFRPYKLSHLFFNVISEKLIKRTRIYKRYCSDYGVDLQSGEITLSVSDAMSLSRKIISELRFLNLFNILERFIYIKLGIQ